MRSLFAGVATSFVVCLGVSAVLRAEEEKVPLDKLPKAVADAVKKRFPDAELVKASKETEDGKMFYEVSVKDKDLKADVTLTAEGQVQEMEKEVAAKDLPAAVTEALEAKYPKAALKKSEEIIKVRDGAEKLESYEVLLVTTEKKTVEVVFSPDGKIIKTEEKKEKEEKDKD